MHMDYEKIIVQFIMRARYDTRCRLKKSFLHRYMSIIFESKSELTGDAPTNARRHACEVTIAMRTQKSV